MTKKDYELIAKAIKEIATLQTNKQAGIAIHTVAANIALHMGNTNPQFDRSKFLNACGVSNLWGGVK